MTILALVQPSLIDGILLSEDDLQSVVTQAVYAAGEKVGSRIVLQAFSKQSVVESHLLAA